jgi:tripartite-type tricarboxylate transporter receptor subunit TctC
MLVQREQKDGNALMTIGDSKSGLSQVRNHSPARLHRLLTRVRSCLAITCSTAAVAILANATYAAPPYPSKPIRVIVPFAPGGGTDLTARLVGQRLTERTGQPVIIDNRPGAGTMLGTELTLKSAPDGYTFMIASASHAINPSLYRKVNYDPIRDFAPITLAISFPFIIAVHPSIPVRNVKEFIAHVKANPGRLTYASSGTGATNHLAGELFKTMAGIDLLHVPYKGGGPAMNDTIGGQVSMIFGTVLETMPQVRAGKLRGLAVSSGKRAAFAPDVPTASEDGLPGYDVTGWYAFLAPAGIDRAVLVKLNQEITGALTSPDIKQKLLTLGAEPWPTTPQQAHEFIAAEVTRWGKLIKGARITAD